MGKKYQSENNIYKSQITIMRRSSHLGNENEFHTEIPLHIPVMCKIKRLAAVDRGNAEQQLELSHMVCAV